MNGWKRWLTLLFLVVVLVGASSVAYAFLGGLKWSGTFEATPADIAWEYKVIALSPNARIEDGAFEEELNKFGKDGWEFVQLVTTQSGGYYIMKRA